MQLSKQGRVRHVILSKFPEAHGLLSGPWAVVRAPDFPSRAPLHRWLMSRFLKAAGPLLVCWCPAWTNSAQWRQKPP